MSAAVGNATQSCCRPTAVDCIEIVANEAPRNLAAIKLILLLLRLLTSLIICVFYYYYYLLCMACVRANAKQIPQSNFYANWNWIPVGLRSACSTQLLSFVLISIIIIIAELSSVDFAAAASSSSSHSAQFLLLLLLFLCSKLKIFSVLLICHSMRVASTNLSAILLACIRLGAVEVARRGSQQRVWGGGRLAVALLLNWAVPKQWKCVRHATTSEDYGILLSPCRHILYAYAIIRHEI